MTKEQIIEIIKNNEMAPSLFYLTSKDGYDRAMEAFSNELADEILALYEAKLKEELIKYDQWYYSPSKCEIIEKTDEEIIDEYLKQRNNDKGTDN